MKIKQCPKCLKNRVNNSSVSFVWWAVKGHGYMCWHCFDKLKEKNNG
jgi:hypothetical protein